MPDTDEELEQRLRTLLRDGVPPLAAPADRMYRVRRKAAVRSRRRRLAGLATATALCALAVTGRALVPGLPLGSGAASPGPADAGAPPPVAAAPASRTADILGVTVALPAGWQTVSMADDQGEGHEFAGNGRVADVAACARPGLTDYACPPVARLGAGRVLVSFVRTAGSEGQGPAYGTAFVVHGPHTPGSDCRELGGDRELTGMSRAGAPGGRAVVARACLKAASPGTLSAALRMLTDAVLTDSASVAPSSPDATPPADPTGPALGGPSPSTGSELPTERTPS